MKVPLDNLINLKRRWYVSTRCRPIDFPVLKCPVFQPPLARPFNAQIPPDNIHLKRAPYICNNSDSDSSLVDFHKADGIADF